MKLHRILLLAAICATASSNSFATDYSAPDVMMGDTAGSTKGNPNGPWSLYQVQPPDLNASGSYLLMTWNGTAWVPKDPSTSFGGQPEGSVKEGAFNLSSRGNWDSTDPKLAALGFTAPKKGKYKIKGSFTALVWAGQGPAMTFHILVRDAAAKTVKEIKSVSFSDASPTAFAVDEVPLEAGQEIIFAHSFPGFHIAANVALNDLTISIKP